MKVQVSKIMAKTLNKYCKEDIKVYFENLYVDQFRAWVDFDEWQHDEDYDIETGTFKVLKVNYPNECYAMPNYVTSKDLHRLFKRCNKTLDSFIEEFNEEYAI